MWMNISAAEGWWGCREVRVGSEEGVCVHVVGQSVRDLGTCAVNQSSVSEGGVFDVDFDECWPVKRLPRELRGYKVVEEDAFLARWLRREAAAWSRQQPMCCSWWVSKLLHGVLRFPC